MSLKTSLEPLSDRLTPNELKNKEFKRTVWGYAPQEVVDFLDATARSWERVQKHEKELLEGIRVLNEEVHSWKKREIELDELKEKARIDAKEIRNQATLEAEAFFGEVKKKADEVRHQTEDWLASVISEVEETERKRDSILAELRTSLDRHYSILERSNDKPSAENQFGKLMEKSQRPTV